MKFASGGQLDFGLIGLWSDWRLDGWVDCLAVVLRGHEKPQAEPVGNLELVKNGSQVGLDGSLANVKAGRYLLVASPLTDEERDLALTGSQVAEINFLKGKAIIRAILG